MKKNQKETRMQKGWCFLCLNPCELFEYVHPDCAKEYFEMQQFRKAVRKAEELSK